MENILSQVLSVAEAKVQYDTQCKLVLYQKEILAWILKNTAEEFFDLSLPEIESCIEGTPEISTVGVNPGETNETIHGLANESKVPGEGSIYYDIRFFACVPRGRKRIRLIINLECQKSYYPGYQIPTRGIFYGARMISSQFGTEFSDSHYDGIKKVYSLWLCLGVPEYIGNAITEYHIVKRDLIGEFPDIRDAYDKLSVVVIGLREDTPCPNDFFGMMNTLFSTTIPADEKKVRLKTKYSLRMENGLAKEVDLMCNLSGYVEEKGIERGLKQGLEQGKKEGLKALVRTLQPLFGNFAQLYDAIVKNPEYADLTEEEVREVI
ncbi:MAG: hypothetical protein MR332_07325 [Fusicatenibacter sp.]|nr:hypothetical protein [Fusicatenibacter sp.]